MLKQMLEQKIGKISNQDFRMVMDMTTADIKFNAVGFRHKTKLTDVISIAEHCYMLIK